MNIVRVYYRDEHESYKDTGYIACMEIKGFIDYASKEKGIKIIHPWNKNSVGITLFSPEVYFSHEIKGGKPFYYGLVAYFATTYSRLKWRWHFRKYKKYEHN